MNWTSYEYRNIWSRLANVFVVWCARFPNMPCAGFLRSCAVYICVRRVVTEFGVISENEECFELTTSSSISIVYLEFSLFVSWDSVFFRPSSIKIESKCKWMFYIGDIVRLFRHVVACASWLGLWPCHPGNLPLWSLTRKREKLESISCKRVRTSLSFMDAIQGLSNAKIIKVFRNLDPAFRKQIEFTLQRRVEKLWLFWKSSDTHTCAHWAKCRLLQQAVSVDTTVLRKGIGYYL